MSESVEPEFLALQAALGELRRLASRALEARVAAPALAAAGHDQTLALAREVAEQRAVGVADLGADGHLHEQLGPVGAALVGAAPVAAVGGAEVMLVTEEREVAQLAGGDEHDVAAGRAVAAVGPASGHVLLAAEAHGAVAAATAAHADLGPVGSMVVGAAGGRRPAAQDSGTTEMKRPAPFSVKHDAPADLGEDGVVDADAGALAGAEPACRAGGR